MRLVRRSSAILLPLSPYNALSPLPIHTHIPNHHPESSPLPPPDFPPFHTPSHIPPPQPSPPPYSKHTLLPTFHKYDKRSSHILCSALTSLSHLSSVVLAPPSYARAQAALQCKPVAPLVEAHSSASAGSNTSALTLTEEEGRKPVLPLRAGCRRSGEGEREGLAGVWVACLVVDVSSW